ncbi:unnamed protein product [Dovyalis caffra]|uniref:Uncharacterized protein n=1 Tax=Dovyalis caffra TaxID=77055 RepID=A0AAV1SF61_9ROSI|nr:unnamed protein product [Dovyalis caffra]
MDDLSRSFFKEQVKLKETNIAAFLDAGLDSLGKLDEIDKVKSDCKYLVSLSQPCLISQQRMETIRNLYYNLDKWSAEYSNSSEILNRYGDLKLLQESQQAEADAKLNDIHAIQESEGEILHELAGAEAKLLDLEKQVLEYKKFVADRKNRLASTQSQILKLCLDVQAMQMNAIKAAADQKSLADEVEKAKRDRSHLEERWQNISSELRLN